MTHMPEVLVAEKFLLVPDCDDDRRVAGEFVNPRHLRALQEVYGREVACVGGWHPARTLVIEDGARRDLRPGEMAEWAASGRALRCRGGMEARWLCNRTGTHRIAVRGGDDLGLEKVGLCETKARAMWHRLQDLVTMKTLRRLGFKPC